MSRAKSKHVKPEDEEKQDEGEGCSGGTYLFFEVPNVNFQVNNILSHQVH
jgi:hypothetical protein